MTITTDMGMVLYRRGYFHWLFVEKSVRLRSTAVETIGATILLLYRGSTYRILLFYLESLG